MNRSESPEAVDILELLVRNPYNQNVPVEEFYRVINHFYGLERDGFDRAIKQLDEEKLVDFGHNAAGDIESMIVVTGKGENLAIFLFPRVFYGIHKTK
jgi:hypothetical protein